MIFSLNFNKHPTNIELGITLLTFRNFSLILKLTINYLVNTNSYFIIDKIYYAKSLNLYFAITSKFFDKICLSVTYKRINVLVFISNISYCNFTSIVNAFLKIERKWTLRRRAKKKFVHFPIVLSCNYETKFITLLYKLFTNILS